jgi:hypothetical protein
MTRHEGEDGTQESRGGSPSSLHPIGASDVMPAIRTAGGRGRRG